jgi:hypothetical protein
VVNAALGRDLTEAEPPEEDVTLVFPFAAPDAPVSARVREGCWSPLASIPCVCDEKHRDIALLQLNGNAPKGARPVETTEIAELWRHRFGAYGYPDEKTSGEWATGRLLHADDAGLVQIEDIKTTGIFVQPGFSGGPVWDEGLGRVVGMIALAEPEPDKRIAFVIPVGTIRRTFPNAFAAALNPFERLAVVPPGSPEGYRTKIWDFVAMYLGSEQAPKPFGGRGEQSRALDQWLLDGDSDRLLVVAPAGRGKSTLLVHWAARAPEGWKVAFVPISIRKVTNRPETFFRALAAHLANALGKSLPPTSADAAGFYHDKAREYLEEYDEGKRDPLLVLLDGLDEAAGFDGYDGLLPACRMRNVKVVASARLTASHPDGGSWLARLGWDAPGRASKPLEVPPLDRKGLEDVLCGMGAPLDQLAAKDAIVSRLLHLTEGDPLLVGLYVEDLWSRRDAAPRLTIEDLNGLEPGYAGYFRKWFEDQKRLWGEANPLRERETLGVLAILACALGPLRAQDIAELMRVVHGKSVCGIPHILEPIERFVIGNPDSSGYALSHPKLGEFLRGADNRIADAAIILQTGKGFLKWGEGVLDSLNEGRLPPKETPEYLLYYYARHLALENAPPARFMKVIDEGWLRAWEAREGGYSGFANDVAATLDVLKHAAREAQGRGKDGDFAFLADRIRCVLCLSSIRNIGANIPAELLQLALRHDLLTEEQALNLIDLKMNEEERASCLVGIAGMLRPSNILRALEAARGISSEGSRSRALAGLAPHLPPELQGEVIGEALSAARSVSSEEERSRALAGLAPHLPPQLQGEVIGEALSAARSVSSEEERSRALAVLAPHLPPQLQGEVVGEALSAARSISDEEDRSRALADLAPHLPPELQGEVIGEALSAARSIGDEGSRSDALAGLAPHLPPELQGEALSAARSIGDEWSRSLALAGLAPHLPPELQGEALSAARSISDKLSRSLALAGLAPHLPPQLQGEVVGEALSAARSISDKLSRSDALAGLAPHLPPQLQGEALSAARGISSEWSRSRTLAGLAPHLPPQLQGEVIGEALSAARSISDEWSRSSALAGLAPHLPPQLQGEVVGEALSAARSISDEWSRSDALAVLAPHLPPQLQGEVIGEALSAACSISSERERSSALAGLAPHLPPQLQGEVIGEALSAARSISDEEDRSRALSGLAPHLPPQLQGEVVGEALSAARSISDELYRSRALAGLAPHLPPQLQGEALSAARSISGEWSRSRALSGLAPHLPPELQGEVIGEALSAARSISSEGDRSRALAGLAPHLPPQLQGEALSAARSISSERERSRALAGLAPHLPPDLQREALDVWLEIASRLERANVLEDMLPFLEALPEAVRTECCSKIATSIIEICKWWP